MANKTLLILLLLCASAQADRLVMKYASSAWMNQSAATTDYGEPDTMKILGTASNVKIGMLGQYPAILASNRRVGVGNISGGYLPSGVYVLSCSLLVKAKSVSAVAVDSTVGFFYMWKIASPVISGFAPTWNRWNDDGEFILEDEWGTAGAGSTSDAEGGYNTSDGSGFDRKATATGTIKFTSTSARLGIALDTTQWNDGLFLTNKATGFILRPNGATTDIVLWGSAASDTSNQPCFVYRIQDMYPNSLRLSTDIRRANTGGMAIGGRCLRTSRGKSTTNANAHAVTRLRRPWTGR